MDESTSIFPNTINETVSTESIKGDLSNTRPDPGAHWTESASNIQTEFGRADDVFLAEVHHALRAFAEDIRRPIAIIDIETTGLNWKSADFGIMEFACILIRPNGAIETLSTFVNPEAKCDFMARRAHGISDEDVANAPTWPSLWRSSLHTVFEEALILGFNSKAFDLPAVFAQTAHYDLNMPNEVRQMDVRSISGNSNLAETAERFETLTQPSHRAMDDAKATAEIFGKIISRKYTEYLHECWASEIPISKWTNKRQAAADKSKKPVEAVDERELLLRYASLTMQKKNAERDLKGIQQNARELIGERPRNFQIENYSFSWTTRKKWNYSVAVEAKKRELKQLQLDEQECGIATLSETMMVTVKDVD